MTATEGLVEFSLFHCVFDFVLFNKQDTLQELKLQGIKIRDGVVFSRYSRRPSKASQK